MFSQTEMKIVPDHIAVKTIENDGLYFYLTRYVSKFTIGASFLFTNLTLSRLFTIARA